MAIRWPSANVRPELVDCATSFDKCSIEWDDGKERSWSGGGIDVLSEALLCRVSPSPPTRFCTQVMFRNRVETDIDKSDMSIVANV